MKFPYIEVREKQLPLVPVEVKNVELYAFLDTGASYSIFQSEVTEVLDIEMESGEKIFVMAGSGSLIPVYLHRIDVKFADKEFKAEIGFSKHLGIGFNIIGRKDFFDNFKICFDEKNEMVEIF